MNLIDVFIIIILALGVLKGIYKGFLHTGLGICAFFVAVLLSLITYPLLSHSLDAQMGDSLFLYVDGSAKLGSVENQRLLVDEASETDLNTVIDTANFPLPYADLIKRNVSNHVFEEQGFKTLGQYTNRTMACAILNTISFLLLFLLYYLIARFAINIWDQAKPFPVLKQFSGLISGLSGFLLYFLLIFVVFMLVPVMLAALDISQISDYIDNSLLGTFFYQCNLFIRAINGVI